MCSNYFCDCVKISFQPNRLIFEVIFSTTDNKLIANRFMSQELNEDTKFLFKLLYLTHLRQMEFPIPVNWISPFSFLRGVG